MDAKTVRFESQYKSHFFLCVNGPRINYMSCKLSTVLKIELCPFLYSQIQMSSGVQD